MAKLTRTQKFAELRETLANDSEPSLSTSELSEYENRLNNITNQFRPEQNYGEIPVDIQDTTTPIDNLVDSFKQEQQYKETVKPDYSSVEPVLNQAIEEFDNVLKEDYSNNQGYNVPKEQPHPYSNIEVSPIGPVSEPVHHEPAKEVAEFEDNKPEYMGLYMNPEVEKAYKENENKPPVYSSYEQQIHTGIVDNTRLSTPVEPEPVVKHEEAPVQPTIMDEPADNHVIDHSNDVQNTFINDVMNEVDQHIKENGEQTITQLTNDMVNEVRRTENRVEETVVNPYHQQANNDDFSNTVSTEISKIMEEVVAADVNSQPAPRPVVTPQPVVTPVVHEEVKPVQPAVEEHPVLAKKLEEEVVEIKNIDDIDINDTHTKEATTGTIPFVVTANDEDLIEDDDEEEGSNTILNIILIILIVILVAVLGLIVFYILKTRGII